MKRGSWKRTERKVAKQMGGERTPLSGSASKHTMGDVILPDKYVEVKSRKKLSIFRWWRDTETKAKKEKKQPFLILHETGTHLYLKVEKMKMNNKDLNQE